MIKEKLKIDLNNPDALSLMQRFFRLIFGKERPNLLTRSFFFTHLVGWSVFFFWYVVAYLSLHFLENIRGADRLKSIMAKRGRELGMEDFRGSYETFAFVMIVFWAVYLIGLIMMWRKNPNYRYFVFSVLLLYPFMVFIFLSFTYLIEDISLFDQILYALMLVSMCIYFLLNKRNERIELESNTDEQIVDINQNENLESLN